MPKQRWLPTITAVFVTSLILSNIIAVKLVSVGPFFVPAAILIFPISYIFGDVLTEVYGYARARRVISENSRCASKSFETISSPTPTAAAPARMASWTASGVRTDPRPKKMPRPNFTPAGPNAWTAPGVVGVTSMAVTPPSRMASAAGTRTSAEGSRTMAMTPPATMELTPIRNY